MRPIPEFGSIATFYFFLFFVFGRKCRVFLFSFIFLQCFRLRNDLYCVEWGVKLYSLTPLQCWHIFPLCEKRPVPLQHLPRGRTQWRMIRPGGIWPSRPNIKTCRSAMGRLLDHRASFRLCGTTRLALLSRGFRLRQSIERLSRWRAWCLADLPGALLQTKLWSPNYYYYYYYYMKIIKTIPLLLLLLLLLQKCIFNVALSQLLQDHCTKIKKQYKMR